MSRPSLKTATTPRRRAVGAVIFLAVVSLIAGCAHPLAIGPDISKIERDGKQEPIGKNVGYYIAADVQEKAVVTPGGGGDSVSYFPYKDLEAGFYKMLGNVFTGVTRLKSPNDAEAIARKSITYIVTPEIKTDSSSPSPFTWPPTTFVVGLTCKITDTTGKIVGSPAVTGAGQAQIDEFKADFSLSGKRASQDALLKMQDALLRMPELRNP